MKLGSLAVHIEEFLSPGGHDFDKTQIEVMLDDQEIKQWLKDMGPLLPLKRS